MSSCSSRSETGFESGLSDPESVQYQHRRQVFDVVNRLHSYGLQNQMDIPQVAVIGSQSVGKSSLIESVSGITLPRATGTCTRCPIECRLSRTATSWTCKVYLRTTRQPTEIPFGPTMTDKTEVQERIRRAQQAILNPSRSIEEFLRGQPLDIEHNEHSFSQDFISVRISGRDVDDLSFVDLPGIIASVRHGGREADIQDIRDLALSFINKQNCLILLVVSCETDIENQGARELAKQVDPNGDRTIPVLTKPDRIATAAHRTWLELLENEQERFQHGWFCVKQSNQQQLEDGISWREARRNEVDFFENTAPWSGLDESIRRRLGTRALTEALGVILFDLICESLPELFREVLRKLQATKDAIRELPKKPEGDPIGILWKLLGAFQKDISQLVAGRPEDGDQGLLQLFRQYRLQFRESIFNQAPQFKPSPGSQKPLGYGRYINTAHNGEPLEPSVRDSSTVVDLNEVMNVAANSITRELPTNYPYAVKKRYVARFMAKWQQPTQLFFEKMERQFLKELKGLVTRHFEQYATGGLDKAILKIVLSQLEQCSVRTKERVEECLALEQEEPMTCNEQYLSHYKAQYLVRYKAVYGQAAQQLLSDDHKSSRHMQNVIDSLAELGVRVDRNDVFMRLCSSTNSNAAISEAAIDIMAEVSAYYQVAFKRYVDYVSLIIDVNLLKGLNRRIDQALIDGLTLGRQDARERAGHLLKENPATERRRRVLSQDLERFEAARLDLQNIPGIQLAGLDEIDEGGEDDIRNDTSDNHVQSGTPQETLIVAREEVMEHTEEIQWRPAIVPTVRRQY